jgi:hypothetical protein
MKVPFAALQRSFPPSGIQWQPAITFSVSRGIVAQPAITKNLDVLLWPQSLGEPSLWSCC